MIQLCQQITFVKVIRDKKLQSVFIEKQQKYQHYHHVKLINMTFLQAKKYYPLVKFKWQKMLNLHIFLQGKHSKIRRLNKKQVNALTSLDFFNTIKELKQIESIFSQNQVNGLIIGKLKEIKQIQNHIELNKPDYDFSKYSLPTVCFKRYA